MPERYLSEIWVYPVKSLGGIRVSSAKVLAKGLEYDRRWMVIDQGGQFMSQRAYPAMALLQPSLAQDRITLTHKHTGSSVTFDLDETSHRPVTARIWNDTVEVAEVRDDIHAWLSHHLNMNCRLVRFPEENPRALDERYAVGNDHVSLADAYPFLLIGQASLDDLNKRLKEQLPMNRFRPNFVFTGGTPFEEDTWKTFSIGSGKFVAVKPCDRCVMTTVDQHTGTKGSEPLITLATFRKQGNKILFGQNLIGLTPGCTISEGDLIDIGLT